MKISPASHAVRVAHGALVPVSFVLLMTLALVISGCAAPPVPAATAPPRTPTTLSQGALLPREVIIPLDAVKEIAPEISKEIATGQNETVVGNPNGNRSVTYATADGSQRVVISVDKYSSAQEASAAYQQAYEASKKIPGVTGETVPGVGDGAFVGIITQGTETHVGGGAVFGDRVITVTLQAYAGTDENKAKVIALIRKQADTK